MSKKIIGVTVGTPTSPRKIADELQPILCKPQTLTEEQKAQARANIGAAAAPKPIAYLYNGVELPPLPESEFPCAFIYSTDLETLTYGAFMTQTPVYYDASVKCLRLTGTVDRWSYTEGTGWWSHSRYDATGKLHNNRTYPVIWTSHDIMDAAGELYMAKSPDPVPVYPAGGGESVDSVLYTPQTLTPEQQEQARANIGAGLPPALIDLDTYGGGTYETSVGFQIISLLFNGGGEQDGVEVGSLFSDLTTDRPIKIQFSLPVSDTIMARITVDGVTTVRIDDQVVELYLTAQYAALGVVASALAYITASGTVRVSLIMPGPDREELVAELVPAVIAALPKYNGEVVEQ